MPHTRRCMVGHSSLMCAFAHSWLRYHITNHFLVRRLSGSHTVYFLKFKFKSKFKLAFELLLIFDVKIPNVYFIFFLNYSIK